MNPNLIGDINLIKNLRNQFVDLIDNEDFDPFLFRGEDVSGF